MAENNTTAQVDEIILSRHPGESLAVVRRERPLADLWILAGVVITAIIFIASGGNFFLSLAFVSIVAIVGITLHRLDYGFYIFIGLDLLLDQFAVPGFQPYTYMVNYFTNLKMNPLMPPNDITVSLMEIHLLLLVVVWLVRVGVKKNALLNHVPVWFAAVMFFLWILGSFVYGQMSGGDFMASLWESRAFFYLGLMYVFVPQVIQTRKQLQVSIWVCIAAISVKALQGIARFVLQGFTFGDFRTLTNHDDPAFFITLFLLLTGLLFFGGDQKQRRALLLLVLPLVAGFFTGLRRATYVSLLCCVLGYLALLPKRARSISMRYGIALAFLFAIYVAAFWNSDSTVGIIAQQVKVMLLNDPKAAAGGVVSEDYSSNLYRKWEDYNLSMTFKKSPLFGIGFGVRYDMPLVVWGLDRLSYLIYYIPHNQILWLAVKMGAIGYFWFFFFFNAYLFKGASVFSRLKDPYLKSVCAVCLLAIINQLVVAFFDMQLTWYRSMIYLGFLMGLLPTLVSLDHQHEGAPSSIDYLWTR